MLTPWSLGETWEALASVSWVQVGEERAEVRVPCQGRRTLSSPWGSPTFLGPAPLTCPLYLYLGSAKSPLPLPSAGPRAEDITLSSRVPPGPSKTTGHQQLLSGGLCSLPLSAWTSL